MLRTKVKDAVTFIHPAGPAVCRHVQLCLKRGRLCTLLYHGECVKSLVAHLIIQKTDSWMAKFCIFVCCSY